MSEDTAAPVDDYAADVFDGVSDAVNVESTGPASWEEAESYEAPVQGEEADAEIKVDDGAVSEEASELFKTDEPETTDEVDTPVDEDSTDTPVEESTDDSESGEEGEAEVDRLELSEELTEKGLAQSEDGALGKMIKVDGEDTFVSLEDLGNDYSGQQAISKRFNEINAEKTAHQREVDQVNSYINTFGDKMKEGDSLSAMQYMGEFAGIAPYQVKRQLIEQLRPEIEQMYEMSAPELQSKYTQEENEYLKQSLESKEQQSSAQQAQSELQGEISTIRETHNIEDAEWDQAIAYLQEHETQMRADDPNLVMDAAFVADVVNDSRAYTRAETALEGANVDLSLESNAELLQHLQEVAYRNPDFDQNDLVELVNSVRQDAVKTKTSTSLENRVNKHGAKPTAKVENNNQISPEEKSYLDDVWD